MKAEVIRWHTWDARRRNFLKNAICLGLVPVGNTWSQTADQVMRIWVGAPAGGTTDTMARLIAPALAQELGQAVVVENRAGAGGNLAAELVARASPDGRTLLMSFTSHTINASLFPHLPFDPIKDFTPISRVSTSPSVLVANPSLPASNIRELIALAKSNPGKLNFAIGALGSSLHLAGEAFKMRADVQIVNIPYRGTSPAVQDLLAGQVELMFAAVGNVLPHLKTRRLKALGVTSSQRLSLLPEVATVAETLAGFESSAWFGLFGPARLAPEILNKLNLAVHQVLRRDDIRKFIEADGASTAPNTPSDFARFLVSDIQKWREVVKFSGAKPE